MLLQALVSVSTFMLLNQVVTRVRVRSGICAEVCQCPGCNEGPHKDWNMWMWVSYYWAQSISWYSLARSKHAFTPSSSHSFWACSKNSWKIKSLALKFPVEAWLWIPSAYLQGEKGVDNEEETAHFLEMFFPSHRLTDWTTSYQKWGKAKSNVMRP